MSISLLKRALPHVIVAAIIIGAIVWIDHRGYERAQKDAKFERTVTALLIERRAAKIEGKLIDALAARDAALVDRLGAIDHENRTVIQPIIREELRNAPHLSDPDAGYGERLRDAINAAISQSACPSPAVGDDC